LQYKVGQDKLYTREETLNMFFIIYIWLATFD